MNNTTYFRGLLPGLMGQRLSTNPSTKQVILVYNNHQDFSDGSDGKESTCDAGDPGSVPGSGKPPEEEEDRLEKEVAIHSSTLAWKIPWMEESDRLQSMGSRKSDST